MHTALQNNAVHYGLNCISTSCSKKVENNLQNPSAVRMAYIDTQTRSPAIHLKQMRKQTVEIIENKYQINIVLHKFCEHSISQGTIVSPKGNKKTVYLSNIIFWGITICIMGNMKVTNCLMK